MIDSRNTAPLAHAWLAFARSLAVAAGCASALAALVARAGLATACVRGAVVLAIGCVTAQAGAWLVTRVRIRES